ncbi:MAG: hypothetical protein WAK17_12320 [Candidatus Nitrosopolaris sp.]
MTNTRDIGDRTGWRIGNMVTYVAEPVMLMNDIVKHLDEYRNVAAAHTSCRNNCSGVLGRSCYLPCGTTPWMIITTNPNIREPEMTNLLADV